MCHGPNFWKFELVISHVQGGSHQLRRIAFPPSFRAEIITDFEAPTGVEWILVQPTPSYYLVILAVNRYPRGAAISPPSPFMTQHPPTAFPKRFIDVGMAHGISVTKKFEEHWNVSAGRRT